MDIDQWMIATLIVKVGIYAASFITAGTALYWRVIDRKGLLTGSYSKIVLLCATLAVVLALFQISIRAGFLIDDGLAGMTDTEMLALAVEGPMGQSTGTLIVGLALLIIAALFAPLRDLFVFAGALLVAVSFALIGHATDDPRWLLTLFITIHLLAVSFWLGALLPLYTSARNEPALCAEQAHRFGQVASLAVPMLIVMGVGFVAVRFGGPFALIGSSYGIGLVIKLILVGLLLMFAAMNKLRYVPAMRNEDGAAATRLQKSIVVEAFCFGGIFMATAFLTTAAQLPN